jgi:hypothetical protein
MSISQRHIGFYKEIFALPGFLDEPVLVFGFQDISVNPVEFEPWSRLSLRRKLRKASRLMRRRWKSFTGRMHPDWRIPEEFSAEDVSEFLLNRGVKDFEILDCFDERATLHYDMNDPVPVSEHGRYKTFIDIGCLEHVFDTRQCLENCLRMVRIGGYYALMTPVNGCFSHGLHVFNPLGLALALQLNGFDILYQKYLNRYGKPITNPEPEKNVLVFLVGRKTREFERFTNPQQDVELQGYSFALHGNPAHVPRKA